MPSPWHRERGVAAVQRRSDPARTRVLVVLVGDWLALPAGCPEVRSHRMIVQRAPTETRHLKELVATAHPEWLLIGPAVDEPAARSAVLSGQAMHPELRLAMLGQRDDLRRCERWMRRGCHVYMEGSTGLDRVGAALDVADELRLVVIDRVFTDTARARQIQPVGSLTRREEEVLQLLCTGLRNSDIAHTLHLTENTVEFHVSRVLAKLGARNRVEAVDRAMALGLA
jgi:DNA-binding NarL/FixJ family response regulator